MPVVKEKFKKFVKELHKQNIKKIGLISLQKALMRYFGVRDDTARRYIRNMVQMGFLEERGNIFIINQEIKRLME